MNRAYLFPLGEEIDLDNVHQATPVHLRTPHDELDQAARHQRLRCPYGGCLERVKLVHREQGSLELKCFSHLPATPDSPPCPYRTEGGLDGGGSVAKRLAFNLRKIIENALHVELQRALKDRGAIRITSSAYQDPEPRIRIEGMQFPLEIRALAPGAEPLWSRPFDGSLEGVQVLFFVLAPDLPELMVRVLNLRLLHVRPALLVLPTTTEGKEHQFVVTSVLPPAPKAFPTARPFNAFDILFVDYRTLFGFPRPPEIVFIAHSHRKEIDHLQGILAQGNLAPAAAKLLRFLAKRLLIEGAGVHRTAFGQTREEARSPFQVCETFPAAEHRTTGEELRQGARADPVKKLLADRPLLASLCRSFFLDSVVWLEAESQKARDGEAALQREIETNRKELEELRRGAEKSERELVQQAEELDGERRARAKADTELGRLSRSLGQLGKASEKRAAELERRSSEQGAELRKERQAHAEAAAEIKRLNQSLTLQKEAAEQRTADLEHKTNQQTEELKRERQARAEETKQLQALKQDLREVKRHLLVRLALRLSRQQ